MRWIAKTTILWLANIIRRIVYSKNDFFCTLCYDVNKAKRLNGMIRNELARNPRIIADFWLLYKMWWERWWDAGYDTKGIGGFVTENGIKVQAYWMWSTLRWEIHDHKIKGKMRPDFLLIDDIDNNDNTKNKRIIQDDMDFIYSEVIAGMEQWDYNIVRLGNVIRMDWRNVRQETIAKADDSRRFFDNFLYGTAWKTTGEICWSRYVENKEDEWYNAYWRTVSIETLKKDWKEWFAQNAIWLPLTVWDVLYDREWTKYFDREVKSYTTYIWIDPAFSLKTGTDWVGICVASEFTENGETNLYIQTAFALYWKDKDEDNILKVVQWLKTQYNVSRVYVEINSWWVIVERVLSKNLIATQEVKTTRDKATRFLEIKGHFLNGNIYFKRGKCDQLIEQLNVFTWEDGGSDDIVDALICAIWHRSSWYFL